MDADIVIVATIASLGPTLAGVAAYVQARAANRAVNHVGKNEPNLVSKVDDLATAVEDVLAGMAEVRVEVAEARVLAVKVKRDLGKFNEAERHEWRRGDEQ